MPDPTREYQPHSLPTADASTGDETRSNGESTPGPDGDPPDAPAPVALPGFELLAEIGRGGMGVVYRARETSLNRDVALKLLQEKYAPASLAARRFLDEARITGQLQHPGIPPIYAVGTFADGRPFLAMKLIKGLTLAEMLKAGKANRGSQVAVFEQICQAVAYAHNHGVVHRDLKPANVMVGAFGEVQVMDWGLAKFRSDSRAESPEASTASTFHDPRADDDWNLETHTGSFLGTPAYMSPEQAIGAVDQIDERSDVFGLGGLLCVILTGQPPFVGGSPESTRQLAAERKLDDAFARLDACGAEPELIDLCRRCLAADRGKRPRNAGEVATIVRDFRVEAEGRARQAEVARARAEVEAREQRKRRRVQLVLMAAIALLVLGAGAFAWWKDDLDHERKAVAEREAADRRATEARIAGERDTEKRLKWYNAGNALYGRGDLNGAVSAFREACKLDPSDVLAHYNLGLALDGQGDIDGAIAAYRDAIKYGASFAPAHNNLGLALESKGDVDGAIAEYKEAIKHDATYAKAHYNLGNALSDKKDFDGAIAAYKEAIKLNAKFAPAYINLGHALKDKGDVDGAIAAYRGAIKQDPALASAHYYLGITLHAKGDATGAMAAYKEAIKYNPKHFRAHTNLGELYIRQLKYPEAIACARAAIVADPRYSNAHAMLGYLLQRTGDITGARAAYTEAVRLDPRWADDLAKLPPPVYIAPEPHPGKRP